MSILRRFRTAKFSERHVLGVHLGTSVMLNGREFIVSSVMSEVQNGGVQVVLEDKETWRSRYQEHHSGQ